MISMPNLSSIKVRGEFYVPNKYKNQASEYNKCVQGVSTTLDGAISELENINSMLGLDSESAKDVLTKNVLVGNEEIKEEIKNLVNDLGNYSGVVSKIAKKLDEELFEEAMAIKAEMDRQEALRRARLKEEAKDTVETKTIDNDSKTLSPRPRVDKIERLLM